MTRKWLAATALWGGLTPTAWAVCPTPSPDLTVCSTCLHTEIADAVAVAANNDVICVEDGSPFTDPVVVDGIAVTIETSNGAAATTLDATSGNEMVRVENGGQLTLQDLTVGFSNARRGFFVTGSSSLVLDGVEVRNLTDGVDGAALYLDGGSLSVFNSVFDGNGTSGNTGGAIFAVNATSVFVQDTDFTNNSTDSAGAVRLAATPGTFTRVTFDGNDASSGNGGAISIADADLDLVDCTFVSNTSTDDGGALALTQAASLTVDGGLFTLNRADRDGGAIHHAPDAGETLLVTGTTFDGNVADDDGNGDGDGGAIHGSNNVDDQQFFDAIFDANSADFGGALYLEGTPIYRIVRATFCNNDAGDDGGGVYVKTSGAGTGDILNSLFQGNTSGTQGGGLYVENVQGDYANNAFLDNDAADGDGMYTRNNATNVDFRNNAVAYNGGEGVHENQGNVTADYNLWFSNGSDVVSMAKGGSAVNADPDFTAWSNDGACNDDLFPTPSTSPLIDAGDPAAPYDDLDGTDNDIGIYGGPEAPLFDSDGDGDFDNVDCAPLDPTIFSGAIEQPVDGVDQNCDNFELCYADEDDDGYGSNATTLSADLTCLGSLVSDVNTDCAPLDPAIHPTAPETAGDGVDQDCDGFELCYDDNDNDGFGGTNPQLESDLSCDAPNESANNLDCDDFAPNTFPGAAEIPANDNDESCDGFEECYADGDDDGYGTAALQATLVWDCSLPFVADNPDDCADADPARNPGATEIPASGIDEDCDGGEICYVDTDGDNYGSSITAPSADFDCADLGEAAIDGDCVNSNPAIHPGALEIPADGVDQNCDTDELCYDDLDNDGFAGETTLQVSDDLDCQDAGEFSTWDDCADSDPSRNPGALEVPASGVDEDCDGSELCWRDGDGDTYGHAATTVVSPDLVCTGTLEAANNTDCNDADPAVNPGAGEVTADGVDGDCSGTEDCYQDSDFDGFGSSTVVQSNDVTCTSSGVSTNNQDCNAGLGTVYPGAPETPSDGIDQSCDGVEVCWEDGDGDGFGTQAGLVDNGDLDCDDADESWFDTDCNDSNPGVFPGATEIPNNNRDDSCDGQELCPQDADNDEHGWTVNVLSASIDCTGALVASIADDCDDTDGSVYPGAPEVLDDGIDQDCNLADTITCYADGNLDGYGALPTEPTYAVVPAADGVCDVAQGESSTADDCDDADSSIHPNATEIKEDGIDQDCFGGDLIDCYVDDDDDGYGDDPFDTVLDPFGDCSAANMADTLGDCDDTDNTIYPDAPDACGDGIDQNCSSAGNGIIDDDEDGLDFDLEALLGTDDCLADTDADGVDDPVEVIYGSDPTNPDSDGDSLLDGDEYVGLLPLNSDSDGVIDANDPDDDDDLVPTIDELAIGGGDWDGDGLDNHVDADDDNDTLPTRNEDVDFDGDPRNDDTDGDGDANWLDPDDDNDGVDTALELAVGAIHTLTDSDADGVLDGVEYGLGGVAQDTDGDQIPDIIDSDDDGDGHTTLLEGQADIDGDMVPNYQDDDLDGDGKPDSTESATNDNDNDGVTDLFDPNDNDGDIGDPDRDGVSTGDEQMAGSLSSDPDTNHDGVHDGDEIGPNPLAPLDSDGDGEPDWSDQDDDGDGVSTLVETGLACPDGSDFTVWYEADGLHWWCYDYVDPYAPELLYEIVPVVYLDTDFDTVPNYLDPDDDGDGVPTAAEDTNGNGDWTDDDEDGDGVPDYLDGIDGGPTGDLDGDGIANGAEEGIGSDPLNPDTDGDGIPDGLEVDWVAGGPVPFDSDLDGILDFNDRDDDQDGVPTNDEGWVDTDGDGFTDHLDLDSDGDGEPDADEAGFDSDCDGLDDRVDALEPPGGCDDGGSSNGIYTRQGCEGCASAPAPGLGWLLIGGAGLLLRRRRR